MAPTTKTQWRSTLRAARLSMDDGVRARAAAGLASAGVGWATQQRGTRSPGVVCAFVSAGHEPDTAPLLEGLVRAGHRVYVPVCEAEHQLSWTAWIPGVNMARSTLAPVMEPTGPRLTFAALGNVDGILLPALAVDLSGVRLGQGGGYYDRFLESLDSHSTAAGTGADTSADTSAGTARGGGKHTVPTAAVVHEQEVFPHGLLPYDALDQPVGWIVTPGGWSRAMPPDQVDGTR